MTDVLIAGAGPVGLTLALVLRRAGVDVRIIDRAPQPSTFCRAIGVTPRTLEVMEDLGAARDLIDAGLWLEGMRTELPGAPPRDIRPDYSDLTYAALGVPQYATEAVLTAHLAAMGVTPERGVALTGLAQGPGDVGVTLDTPAGPQTARCRYLVGCDGAHSAVRKALGLGFEGDAFPMEFMLGDVAIDWDLPRGMTLRAIRAVEDAAPDIFVAIPLPDHGRYRVSTVAPERLSAPGAAGSDHGLQSERPGATLADLQAVADRLLSAPARLSDLRWSSLFRISMRLASAYRVGRVFIAGDACHIHPPTGGQGMNTGIQDAYNLGWKLALVVAGRAGDSLLDSYEAERRPVAVDVIARTTEASLSLGRDTRKPNRLEDTQLLVSYAGGPLAAGPGNAQIRPGDRAPDIQGLRRRGLGFALRLFDLLRGPKHVLLLPLASGDASAAEAAAARFGDLLRVIAIAPGDAPLTQPVGVELLQDVTGAFAEIYGAAPGGWLLRPDNHIGLHMPDWSADAVADYLRAHIGVTGSGVGQIA